MQQMNNEAQIRCVFYMLLGKHFNLQVGSMFGALTSAYPLGKSRNIFCALLSIKKVKFCDSLIH